MVSYIVRRLLTMIPMLLIISILVFLLMHAAPGNAIESVLNPRVKDPAALVARLKAENGLDKTLPVQYIHWLGNILRGNLGFSFSQHAPVSQLLWPALRNTLYFAILAEIFTLILGIPVGIKQAKQPYSGFDNTASIASITLFSVPYYIIAIFLIFFLSIKVHIFPAQNAIGTGTSSGSLVDHLYHALLPALSIAIATSAIYSRYTRGSMLEVSRKDYVRTAYAKGLTQSRVFNRHVFRNGMIPIVTQFGLDFGTLAGGAIILEGLFAYQGMGYLTIQAAEQRDYSVIMATTLLIAVGVLLGNLIADVLYAVVDPRIRYD